MIGSIGVVGGLAPFGKLQANSSLLSAADKQVGVVRDHQKGPA